MLLICALYAGLRAALMGTALRTSCNTATLTSTHLAVTLKQQAAIDSTGSFAMALQFIGIDPNTDTGNSPTVWYDEVSGDIVIQGYRPDLATVAECAATTAPGHAVGIPDSETVIRVPGRMASIIREACNVAEGSGL